MLNTDIHSLVIIYLINCFLAANLSKEDHWKMVPCRKETYVVYNCQWKKKKNEFYIEIDTYCVARWITVWHKCTIRRAFHFDVVYVSLKKKDKFQFEHTKRKWMRCIQTAHWTQFRLNIIWIGCERLWPYSIRCIGCSDSLRCKNWTLIAAQMTWLLI